VKALPVNVILSSGMYDMSREIFYSILHQLRILAVQT
jgi:hypothetical protein